MSLTRLRPTRGLGAVSSATQSQVQSLIVSAAQKYGVPAWWALGIASHESGFNPNAVNTANANGTSDWGVMQLNDTTVKTMGVSNPLDPAQNVDAGVKLLSQLSAKYNGDLTQVLWAYAAGPGSVSQGNPPAMLPGFVSYVQNWSDTPIATPPDDSSVALDSGAAPVDSTDLTLTTVVIGGLLALTAVILLKD